jgi:hypothetical protein
MRLAVIGPIAQSMKYQKFRMLSLYRRAIHDCSKKRFSSKKLAEILAIRSHNNVVLT